MRLPRFSQTSGSETLAGRLQPAGRQGCDRHRRPKINRWSKHSRRAEPTQRSANAFRYRPPEGQADDVHAFSLENLIEGCADLRVLGEEAGGDLAVLQAPGPHSVRAAQLKGW